MQNFPFFTGNVFVTREVGCRGLRECREVREYHNHTSPKLGEVPEGRRGLSKEQKGN